MQNTKIDRENDDYYPKMAVGTADNLAGVDVVDSEINFRRSGGGAITDGVARIESIKGNSVVWNQRLNIKIHLTYDNTSATSTKYAQLGLLPYYTTVIKGHKIFAVASDSEGKLKSIYFNDLLQKSLLGGYLFTASTSVQDRTNVYAEINAGVSVDTDVEVLFYDLTQMFGSGNEPTTIEEFYARIPMGVDLNAYNEGEVIHMDVQSIESVGVNQWDEEWEIGAISGTNGENIDVSTRMRSKNYIPLIPFKDYSANIAFGNGAFFYDDKKEFIIRQYGISSIPQNARYMRFVAPDAKGTTYNHDICINISDTAVNGKYFPYIKRVEDLSVIRKYFPDGMKSAGTAHDEIRYNKESGKWEKVVRIGEVDMGSLTWSVFTTMNGLSRTQAPLATFIGGSEGAMSGILCSKFVTVKSTASMIGSEALGIFGYTNNRVFVLFKEDDYADAASFKAAVSGVTLYYELAEPIVTELDEADQFKDLDYQVWNAGTEKAIAEGKSAPLAADITYGFNAIGKIKELESLVAALRVKVGI